MIRQGWIDASDAVPIVRQCRLAGVLRATSYAHRRPPSEDVADLLAAWCPVLASSARMTINVISSKSSRPSMVSTNAVVSPPLNRLSISFSSFTSIIERMAWSSNVE